MHEHIAALQAARALRQPPPNHGQGAPQPVAFRQIPHLPHAQPDQPCHKHSKNALLRGIRIPRQAHQHQALRPSIFWS
ncbi:MAG: hypothetical protein KDE69_15845, partial [Burkholderiaceae bacterium]|nr:hypothetical protein [Burkholderiaceae bacterium]